MEKLSRWNKTERTDQEQIRVHVLKTHLEGLRGIHSDIVDLTRDIQEVFGPYILVSVLAAFGVITIQLYYIFATSIQAIHFNIPMMVITLIWTFTHALLIIANVIVCSSTRNASKATGGALLSVREAIEYPEIFHIIQLFSFQLWHKEIQFTACGFFTLDSKLITSVNMPKLTHLLRLLISTFIFTF